MNYFDNFLQNAGDLGLKYIDNKYVNPKDNNNSNATAQQAQAQKYERITQKAPVTPVAQPINKQYLLIGGGVGALLLLAIVLKK